MHTGTVDGPNTMLNERGTAADYRTEPKTLFGSRPVKPNIRMDFQKDVPLLIFSNLAPGRGPFPSKFPKFGLQNLPILILMNCCAIARSQ